MFVFIGVGLALLVYPRNILRWTIRRHQWLADDRFTVGLTRFIGGCFILFNGVFLLEMWISANR
jgi:hypothetical protein